MSETSTSPFDSVDEARFRIMAQWEYEGKLKEPWTEDLLMALHKEIMRYAPNGPAAVFPWHGRDSNPQ